MTRAPEAHTIVWRGVTIAVTFDPQWLGSIRGAPVAHLEVCAIMPECAPLPFTGTGYRSHFTDPAIIAAAGGPAAFVRAWLDREADAKAWKDREEAARQLALF